MLTGTIEDVKEFAVGGVRYIRAEVDYDKSSDIVGQTSRQKAPEYEKRMVFLKELVSGSPALYSAPRQQRIHSITPQTGPRSFRSFTSSTCLIPIMWPRTTHTGIS